MLTAIHIYNIAGDKLELPLDASSGYVVKSIDGLGPVKADIITTEYVGRDGGAYQNAKGNMRNIVFQLGFSPSYESVDPIGELRRNLYNFLTPKMKVEMYFLNDSFETVSIIGYVESFEPSIFSDDPEVQVSILCPDPYFNSLVPITVSRQGDGSLSFINPGNVDVGLTMTVGLLYSPFDYSSTFTLARTSPSVETMSYVGPVFMGNYSLTVRIISIKGSKSVTFGGVTLYELEGPLSGGSLLGYVDGWVDVVPGLNTFDVNVPPGFYSYYDNGESDPTTTLTFVPRYSGL